jgi:beta-galactosidase
MNRLSHKRPAALSRFYFGSAYYPEQWDEAARTDDGRRMKEAGWNCVRMAEFAWDRLEVREGVFDFSLFDQSIHELGGAGIATILCTPTAAPPRWLTVRHPEVLRVDENGVPLQHGSRQHVSHASPVFRDYSRGITRAMAEHFRDNPHVVGWQTDNEFHCHFSEDHSDAARGAFVEFLRGKFNDDISALNAAWGTAFWAQTYNSFEDIPTPRRLRPAEPNPAHQLDYFRFLSHAVTVFQRDQVEILRQVQPQWFVTHNGCFEHIDYRGEFGRDLDMLSYDSYPFFQHDPQRRAADHAFNLDRTRAWTGNFMLMEQQSGPGGQAPYFHDNPEPGEMRRMAYTSIARGADSLFFFRWRTARFGAEQYWCGILDQDNIPRRRYREVAQLGAELKRIGPEVLQTSVYVDVAVAASDMDVMDSDRTYSLGLPTSTKVGETPHEWLFRHGFAVGCVHPSDDLSGLKLYIIPHWTVFDPAWLANLEAFVRQGGTLVLGARSATRDLNNNVVAEPLPGALRALAGVIVEEYGRQNAPEKRPLHIQLESGSIASTLWYEALQPQVGTEVPAHWQGRHLTGQPAITLRRLERGHVVYVGSYLTKELVDALLPRLAKLSGASPLLPSAVSGVEIVRRDGAGKRLWFFINHAEETITLRDVPHGADLITDDVIVGTLMLHANGVAVIKQVLPLASAA